VKDDKTLTLAHQRSHNKNLRNILRQPRKDKRKKAKPNRKKDSDKTFRRQTRKAL